MLTVFEKIPDLFVQMYDAQFRVWAAEYRVRGPRCAIVFGRPRGATALLDGEGRVVERGAWLEALRDGERMVVQPASEHDAEMIARHCWEMAGHVLH